VCSAHSQLAHPLALETDSVCLWELKWHASAMRATRDMTAPKRHAPMTALVTESALVASAHARTVGVVLIVLDVALVTVSAAVAMESVLRVSATATPVGLDMPVTCAHASMTAPSTVTATTELASAKRDTADVTARSQQNPNLASVPSTAFEVAFNSALRCTRHRELGPRMSATRSALRSAYLSVSQARCLSISLEPLTFQSRPLTNFLIRWVASSKLETLKQ